MSPLIEQYLFDDALLLEEGKSDLRAALAGLEDTHASFSRFVRFVDDCLSAVEDAPDGVVPKLERVTLERWFPQQALQTLTNSGVYVNAVGVSRSVPSFRQTPAEEVTASLKIPSHAAAPEDFVWHNTPWEVLMALSARLHRHPLPTWYLAKLAGVPQTAATAS